MIDNWHALFVLTGSEDKVKERLEYCIDTGLEFHVPKRRIRERKNGKWADKIRVLFPGYVLFKGNPTADEYYWLKTVPGIIRPLSNQHGFLCIREEEISTILKLTCNSDIIDYSSVLVENGKVKVIDGPLTELEGYIISINQRKGRAKVRLGFLGEERIVELGISALAVC